MVDKLWLLSKYEMETAKHPKAYISLKCFCLDTIQNPWTAMFKRPTDHIHASQRQARVNYIVAIMLSTGLSSGLKSTAHNSSDVPHLKWVSFQLADNKVAVHQRDGSGQLKLSESRRGNSGGFFLKKNERNTTQQQNHQWCQGVQGKIEDTVQEQINGLDRDTQILFIMCIMIHRRKGRECSNILAQWHQS